MLNVLPRSSGPYFASVRKWLAIVFGYTGALVVFVTITPVTQWWAQLLGGPWNAESGEILIVPGADGPSAGVIGQSSYWRSVYAVRAWRTGGFRTIIVAGGNGVADSMKQLIVSGGVPAEAVRTEPLSTSTRENALFTRGMLDGVPGRRVLLTSDYHMFRARRAFERAGMSVAPHPTPDAFKHAGQWRHRWSVFLELCVESTKIARYALNGWI